MQTTDMVKPIHCLQPKEMCCIKIKKIFHYVADIN